MDNELTIDLLKECEVIPAAAKAGVEALYKNAVEKADLPFADYLTIRDLLGASGYSDEPLHALLVSMFMALDEGSLCLKLTPESLKRRLGIFAGERAGELAEKIAHGLKENRYKALIGDSLDEYKPLILRNEGGGPYLYFQKYLTHELSLKTCLDGLLSGPGGALDVPDNILKKHILEVLQKKPMRAKSGKTITLNNEQRMALALGLLKGFAIVSGGPGTGKTSIVITLLRLLTRCGVKPDRIRLAAPTGRAAQRMTDTIRKGIASIASPEKADKLLEGMAGSTIHRLLKYNPSANRFIYNRMNKLPADIVIIDEVSMVDVELMAKLLEALAPQTNVLFLGDKDQLPSVEAGAVLADLMPRQAAATFTRKTAGRIASLMPGIRAAQEKTAKTGALTDRIVILNESYRSETGILEIAQKVNEQDESVIDRIPLLPIRKDGGVDWPVGGARFIEDAGADIERFRGILRSWMRRHYFTKHLKRADITLPYAELIKRAREEDLKDIFAYIEQARVLCPVRYGPFGSFSVNRHIAKLMRETLDPGRYGRLFAGAPVMVTQNDYVKDLYNGEVGVVLRGRDGSHHAYFERSGGFIPYPVDTLPPHELAFAITVHKSQGSEYDNVLVALPPDEGARQLTKEIIYTALTRSRYLAAIYGSKAVLRKAISGKIERESGIRFWD
ncbi:MAG: exodeoxyribonuclease V subunit alpha [Candidatus Omnitrophica bacterium]|nr:exodeoxyribonuclease V subunit alpha [Candidatus Omnitrophota bacterium]